MRATPTRRDVLRVPPAALVAAAGASSGLVIAPGQAHAEPRPGAGFPGFAAHDLNGGGHTHRDLLGRRRFVSTITSTDAADAMRPWLDAAEARLGRARGNIIALIALDLSFIAFDAIVRSQARANTPQWRWPCVWLERDGSLGRSLGLPNGNRVPWVYVVEPNGVVSAAAHAPANHASAQAIWAAMLAP